jgi:hypothetical protein
MHLLKLIEKHNWFLIAKHVRTRDRFLVFFFEKIEFWILVDEINATGKEKYMWLVWTWCFNTTRNLYKMYDLIQHLNKCLLLQSQSTNYRWCNVTCNMSTYPYSLRTSLCSIDSIIKLPPNRCFAVQSFSQFIILYTCPNPNPLPPWLHIQDDRRTFHWSFSSLSTNLHVSIDCYIFSHINLNNIAIFLHILVVSFHIHMFIGNMRFNFYISSFSCGL